MADATLYGICPVFQVANLDRGIEFYTRVMGFDVAWVTGNPPDRANLCLDVVEITLEAVANPVPSHAYIHLEGIDAYFERVSSGGARVIHPLAERDYGMYDGRIADPDGNQLGLGEAIED